MIIQLHLITGIMLGFEYVDIPDEDDRHLVIDFLFLRVLFTWG